MRTPRRKSALPRGETPAFPLERKLVVLEEKGERDACDLQQHTAFVPTTGLSAHTLDLISRLLYPCPVRATCRRAEKPRTMFVLVQFTLPLLLARRKKK